MTRRIVRALPFDELKCINVFLSKDDAKSICQRETELLTFFRTLQCSRIHRRVAHVTLELSPGLFYVMDEQDEQGVGEGEWKWPQPIKNRIEGYGNIHRVGDMVWVPAGPCLVVVGGARRAAELLPIPSEQRLALMTIRLIYELHEFCQRGPSPSRMAWRLQHHQKMRYSKNRSLHWPRRARTKRVNSD